jgi:hypothetical protein
LIGAESLRIIGEPKVDDHEIGNAASSLS